MTVYPITNNLLEDRLQPGVALDKVLHLKPGGKPSLIEVNYYFQRWAPTLV